MLNLRKIYKIEKGGGKNFENGKIFFAENERKKSRNVHRNSIISSRILRNRLMDGMEKCLKIEKFTFSNRKW